MCHYNKSHSELVDEFLEPLNRSNSNYILSIRCKKHLLESSIMGLSIMDQLCKTLEYEGDDDECENSIRTNRNRNAYVTIILLYCVFAKHVLSMLAMAMSYGVEGVFDFVVTWEFNLRNVFLCISAAFFILQNSDVETCIHLAAWMVFLVWCDSTLILARFDIGHFIFMLIDVVYKILFFMLTVVPLFFAFALGFFILLHTNPQFINTHSAFLYTLVMAVEGYYNPADFDFKEVDEIGGRNYSVQIMFFLFLILAVILFMNILLAVTVASVKNLENQGKFRQICRRKKFIIISSFLWKWFDSIPLLRVKRILEECKEHNSYKVYIIIDLQG